METDKGWAEAAGDDEGPDDGCDYWDGRVTNADFADPGPEPAPRPAPNPAPNYEAYPPGTRPLYDGRMIRDPYARRGGYRRASEQTWADARADYLAGDPAEAVSARHGVGLSTLRARAAAEGWRRVDQPDPEPVDLDAEIEAGLPDYADMARHALVRMNRAVMRGRGPEAAGWMRLHMRLLELARGADLSAPPAASPPEPQPKPKPEPRPEPRRDPQATVLAKARTLQAVMRAAPDLDPNDPLGRMLLDKSLQVLDTLGRVPDSDGSDDSDGVFSAPESDPDAGAP